MSNKLLSICIPTYNRADKLQISLLSILRQVSSQQDKIEIIVSDNASTDNTLDLLSNLKEEYPFLKCYRNKINLGFNLNIFKLTDEYASGKFFWLIGDDDVIDSNAIDIIINILENNFHLPFLGLNFRILPIKEILELKKNNQELICESIKMSSLINNQCRSENLLATFMSCNIMLLNRFKNYDKSNFSSNSLNDYKSLFPHSHIIASTVKSNEEVMYISTPLLSVIYHEKEWNHVIPLINLYFIIDVYKYYILNGYKRRDINNTKKIIINSGIGALFDTNINFKFKWSFLKFSLFNLFFYELILFKSLRKIIKS